MHPHVLLIRHDDDPTDDRVETWFTAQGSVIETVRPYRGERIHASPDEFAATVLFGGLFPATESARYPFLSDEQAWIDRCLVAGTPMLGICLGAQLIAQHLGARVGPAPDGTHEFGYYEVTPTDAGTAMFPSSLYVAQSHYHGFEIPEAGERLAESAAFPNQAFRFGERVVGFQFHAEQRPTGFRRWQAQHEHYYRRPGSQPRTTQDALMKAHDTVMGEWLEGFLATHFASCVRGGRSGDHAALDRRSLGLVPDGVAAT
ncbi:MAG: type 1 glutamine amidotransferase [Pseudomonadota bacterium]